MFQILPIRSPAADRVQYNQIFAITTKECFDNG